MLTYKKYLFLFLSTSFNRRDLLSSVALQSLHQRKRDLALAIRVMVNFPYLYSFFPFFYYAFFSPLRT